MKHKSPHGSEPRHEPPTEPERKTVAVATKSLRWFTAVAIVTVALVAMMANRLAVCSTAAQPGTEALIACRPPEVSDAATLAVALLVLLLVLPDFSEVSAYGVSLKTRVGVAERDASDAKAKAYEVQTTLANYMNSSATASAQIHQTINYDSADLRQMAKEHREESKTPSPSAPGVITVPSARAEATGETAYTGRAAEKAMNLIRSWERLQTRIEYPSIRRFRREAEMDPTSSHWLLHAAHRGFFESNLREIETVRAVRNRVAHAIPVSEADLDAAIKVCDFLLTESERMPIPFEPGAGADEGPNEQ